MKKIIICLMMILSLTIIVAENPVELTLTEGKNVMVINDYFQSMYASELMSLHPQIESISIEKYGNTYGYINTLGGVGTNMLIESSNEYEIYSKENITIRLN